tara:strand:+ start:103 stop:579 length:477 start_codon:yes stop_codon:yes gene_type:complete
MIYASIEGDNIAFWVVVCFTVPIAFAFLSRILWSVVAFLEIVSPQKTQIVEKTVYKNRPQKIVYRDQPQKVKIEYRDRRVWGRPQKVVYRDRAPAKNKEKTITSTPATDPLIISGAVNGLGSLGISKAEASLLVKKVCSSKAYFDIENLLKDCLVELK